MLLAVLDGLTALFAGLAAWFWFRSAARDPEPRLQYWGRAPANDPEHVAALASAKNNRLGAMAAGAAALVQCAAYLTRVADALPL